MNIFNALDFAHLQSEMSYVVLIYIGVIIAMGCDFITGVRRAQKAHEATTSRGFRKTVEKASQYFMPMFCLTVIDVIASEFLDYPYLTAVLGVFNIYIELRSIWENTHTAAQKKKQQQCATELLDFLDAHGDELRKLLGK